MRRQHFTAVPFAGLAYPKVARALVSFKIEGGRNGGPFGSHGARIKHPIKNAGVGINTD